MRYAYGIAVTSLTDPNAPWLSLTNRSPVTADPDRPPGGDRHRDRDRLTRLHERIRRRGADGENVTSEVG
jgi:hypothetical protein